MRRPALHILVGDVVDRLPLRRRVPDVLEHLQRRGPDVDLLGRDAQRLHQGPGRRLGPFGGGEAGQGVGQDVRARTTQQLEGAAGDQQGVGGVEPARHADHHLAHAGGLQALGQALDLDVEGLVAVLVEPGRVVRHEGEARDGAAQSMVGEIGPGQKADAAEARLRPALHGRAVVEGAVAMPLQPQPLDIDIGDGQLGLAGEALALGQQGAQLVHRGLSVPGQVGGRLPRPRGGKHIGRDRARRLRGAEQLAFVRLAHQHVRGGQIAEDHRPSERRAARRRDGRPIVLADLGVEDEVLQVGGGEDQVRPEWRGPSGQLDLEPAEPPRPTRTSVSRNIPGSWAGRSWP